MIQPLHVTGKRKIRIILNKCCNKTFCLCQYSGYPGGPAAVQGLITDLRFTSTMKIYKVTQKGLVQVTGAHRCGPQPPQK